MEKITDSSGNIFTDLGFNPEQSAIYTLRAELMSNLRKTIRERKWTQEEAAKVLNIGQSRVSDLMRGKWEKFSLDMLITLAIRVGKRIGITVV
ncbi:helix-turn-helix domain-containing protein [Nitrosomonas europaea]|uniref:Helix-turn-helix motif n=1 Tax=Nitrosomonas europaea (strain ATCC 19718 / CIP 103999 / KCTC 2705 / NBRC 14298) TaxID=228410 RepID=Q82UV0_NITEU|nr:helix-turn-helix transcriptional regulator [Nitrosomonas europaea]CAD85283.1 Helix-turn-helix motif [Nitrosomonas europaea ATCC 19718]SDW94967.1 Predicted DNA-binding protein, contains XRE-type HTH domain [Nitrosomonas europaea]SET48097.1 Predicted DNA-binding protein, contains XRE-type HTH domain [Nitrosomonas europaea]SKA04570.1 Predicted DNA-binding protein, contains XRE-type HTH domain [Nitrosomonas europaea]